MLSKNIIHNKISLYVEEKLYIYFQKKSKKLKWINCQLQLQNKKISNDSNRKYCTQAHAISHCEQMQQTNSCERSVKRNRLSVWQLLLHHWQFILRRKHKQHTFALARTQHTNIVLLVTWKSSDYPFPNGENLRWIKKSQH